MKNCRPHMSRRRGTGCLSSRKMNFAISISVCNCIIFMYFMSCFFFCCLLYVSICINSECVPWQTVMSVDSVVVSTEPGYLLTCLSGCWYIGCAGLLRCHEASQHLFTVHPSGIRLVHQVFANSAVGSNKALLVCTVVTGVCIKVSHVPFVCSHQIGPLLYPINCLGVWCVA